MVLCGLSYQSSFMDPETALLVDHSNNNKSLRSFVVGLSGHALNIVAGCKRNVGGPFISSSCYQLSYLVRFQRSWCRPAGSNWGNGVLDV